MDFTEEELEALSTAVILAERGVGFTLDADRKHDRAVCDRLVKSGHLAAIDGVDGGYRLSDRFARAIAEDRKRVAAEAAAN